METVTTPSQKQPETTRFDIHQHVTDIIIKQLEEGTIPWQRPWKSTAASFKIPQNALKGVPYRGVNIVLLWGATLQKDYASNEWATLKDWNKMGERIRKGESGTTIVFYKDIEKEVDGEIVKIPCPKYSKVFNRAQLDSYQPTPDTQLLPEKPLFDRLAHVEAFVDNTKAIIEYCPNEASYNRLTDKIKMPYPQTFIDQEHCSAQEGYYSTLMHEMVHRSGHPSRLNREFGKKFGDKAYAVEELTAELGAAFLCAELEITTPARKDHAAYIANWLTALRNDKRFVFSAASAASKAVDYYQSLQNK
ncbi:ArdC family protein [Rurimicrobium arvi]|uniref:Zincin-like metallopeptidase domain-containing protein n=1 Tax=Rurimicrobium arvi TaxID=2049916 RepID=A0ABP8N053_9BACT